MPIIPIIIDIVGGFLYAVLGYVYKLAGDARCRTLAFIACFTAVTSIVNLTVGLVNGDGWGDSKLWQLGILAGLDFVCVIYGLLSANKLGPASVVWTVANLALLVPIAVFAIAYKEPFYSIDVLAIGLFLAMIFVFAKGVNGAGEVKAVNAKLFGLTIAGMYITNGAFMVLTKLKDQVFTGINSGSFGTITFGTAAIAAYVLHLVMDRDVKLTKAEVSYGFKAGVVNSLGFLCLIAAMGLPAIVAFPINQGISLLGGTALTVLLTSERLNRLKVSGIIIGFILMMVSVFRENLAFLLR